MISRIYYTELKMMLNFDKKLQFRLFSTDQIAIRPSLRSDKYWSL